MWSLYQRVGDHVNDRRPRRYTLAASYQGDPAFRPFRDGPPAAGSMRSPRSRAQDAEGPTWVADFLSPGTAEDRERIRLDAFMRVREVLRLLGTG